MTNHPTYDRRPDVAGRRELLRTAESDALKGI